MTPPAEFRMIPEADELEQIDRALNDSEKWIDALRQATPSPLKQKRQ